MKDYSKCKHKRIQGEISSENVAELARKGPSNIISSAVKPGSTRDYRIYSTKQFKGDKSKMTQPKYRERLAPITKKLVLTRVNR